MTSLSIPSSGPDAGCCHELSSGEVQLIIVWVHCFVASARSLAGSSARLVGEEGQDYTPRLADGLRGRVGLAWGVSEVLTLRVGAFLSAYPVKDNDAERLLWQVYGLGAEFGEGLRWRIETQYEQVGLPDSDDYTANALNLRLGVCFAL